MLAAVNFYRKLDIANQRNGMLTFEMEKLPPVYILEEEDHDAFIYGAGRQGSYH